MQMDKSCFLCLFDLLFFFCFVFVILSICFSIFLHVSPFFSNLSILRINNGLVNKAASQNVKPRSIPWTHRPVHPPDPYQNAGDPDRSIRLDHRKNDPYLNFDATP